MTEVLSETELQPYDLAHIADFNSLIAISQQLSKPIFALTDLDIKQGWESIQGSMPKRL